jgi:hypothetical protein
MSSGDETFSLIGLTDTVAQYMGSLYRESKDPLTVVEAPAGWSERMMSECIHAVQIILVAKRNRCKHCLIQLCVAG